MTAARIQLSPADRAFFVAENEAAPQVTAMLTLFDRTPELEALKQAAIRGIAYLPRMEFIKDPERAGVLIRDPAFALDAHVRRIHAPGISNMDRLLETVSDLHSTPLPVGRPLWEFLLLSNRDASTGALPEGDFERAAVLWRIHHGLSDGIRSLNVFRAMLASGDLPRHSEYTKESPVSSSHSFAKRVSGTIRVIALTGRMAPVPSPLNGSGSTRRVLTPVEIDRSRLRTIMRRYGVSSHDALLAGLASALRQYHARHGASLDADLRVILPGNSRPIPHGGVDGNFTDLLWVGLPVSEPDPKERLRKTVAAISLARTQGWIEFSRTFPPLIARMPLAVQRQSFRKASMLTNAVCTIMPAVLHRLALDGQSMRHSFAAATLLEGHGAGFTFMTSGESIRGAIITDPRIVSDPCVLSSLLIAGVQELADLGNATPSDVK